MLQRSPEIKGFHLSYADRRYFVPDLSPLDRRALREMNPRFVFVAESPHISEIEPDQIDERRPLCGMAGKKWWSLLSEFLEGKENPDVSQERLVHFSLKHQVSVLNAVQYPLDPKVARLYPEAEPIKNLGFLKGSGEYSYKKLKASPQVAAALESLKARLQHESLRNSTIHCLGNDAEWFVLQALGKESQSRLGEKIPHPSAWWRQNGLFGRIAREKLTRILNDGVNSLTVQKSGPSGQRYLQGN